MLRLMLLRHAKADHPSGIDDRDRPLAERGVEESRLMGRFMALNGLIPTLALVSSARRTRQTWELAAMAFPDPIAEREEPRLYDASSEKMLSLVNEIDAGVPSLLVVGHNPGLSELASQLSGRGDAALLARLHDGLPTAGLAVIGF